ncbi:Cytochrome c oxidase (cbb3-type) subunit CcoN (EC 1.9.3.1) [uncultured Gammaproteobacteria bacterium]|jgi:cytochrome c oxidase cbb3-type subunit 1|nr:Cytochrome c oxidase (cbb3-type) subunit CcoN (EC 1.9.3.1) [uncultured Gammaproteobacteria bacterium]
MNNNSHYTDSATVFLIFCTMIWAIIGMSAGAYLASELVMPWLNFDIAQITFGRLRPFHTNAVIFGFGGSALIATAFYSVQRTCHVRLFAPKLAWIVAIGWQIGVAVGVASLLMGYTSTKEYAEFEWPVDIAVAIVWVSFGIVFFGTLAIRKIRPIYVSNWFYGALIIVVAMLHIVNNLAIPYSWFQSYTVYEGAQDAIVQWWYGHNAVGFFLTAGFLGMFYYTLPKQAGRPVWSYRLSVIAFWAFVYTYIWVGPHHLHYTSIPDWLMTAAMAMSIILILPSWATMLNAVMTMSGAWDKLRSDPGMKFVVVSMIFYALATFEGPMLAIKSVNVISHYTDWTIGHVHSGALGWNAFVTFGTLYFLVPKLVGASDLYSKRLANIHFWLALMGVLIYIVALWASGVAQGIMNLSINDYGQLNYSFIDIVVVTIPYHWMRLAGGLMFLSGTLLMSYNLYKTYASSKHNLPVLVKIPKVHPGNEI